MFNNIEKEIILMDKKLTNVLNKELDNFFVETVFNENLIHCSNYNELFNTYISFRKKVRHVFESARNRVIVSEIEKFLNEDNNNSLFEGGLNNKLN